MAHTIFEDRDKGLVLESTSQKNFNSESKGVVCWQGW